MMYRLGLLLFVATLAVGHHPSTGGCDKVKWLEFKASQEVENAMEICDEAVEKQLKKHLRNYTSNIPTFEMIADLQAQKSDIFSNCLVQRLGYLVAGDGFLDAKKMLAETDKIRSEDPLKRNAMMVIAKMCLGHLGNETSAAKQLQNYIQCISQSKTEYYDLQGRLLEAYLARKTNPSACAAVQWPTHMDLLKMGDECVAEIEANKTKETQQENSSNNVSGDQGIGITERVRRFKNTMLERFENKQLMEQCYSRKMGHYSPETGYDLGAFINFLGNLSGWEPEVLTNVTDAFYECILQGAKYHYCMKSKVVDICGFGNVVTNIFYPFIDTEMEKGALKYAQEVIGVEGLFGGDDDDDDDGDDINDDDNSDEMMDGVSSDVRANVVDTSRKQKRAEDSEESEEEEDDSSESEDK